MGFFDLFTNNNNNNNHSIPSDYIGLSEQVALDKAKYNGLKIRVICRDGYCPPITTDFVTNRINLTISRNFIINATFG